jgi:hypothetical protein
MLQGRPVMISEFGFTRTPEEPTGKKAAQWAHDALEALLSGNWQQVRGFSWWNEAWENDPPPHTEMRVQKLEALKQTFQSQLKKHQGSLVEAPILG